MPDPIEVTDLTRESMIAAHYTRSALADAIREGLEKLEGRGGPLADKLSAVDEFHLGGRPATEALADALALEQGARVLDIGCGIGGTARWIAAGRGVMVEGIDLTPAFVDLGKVLTRDLGLEAQVRLRVANALALPFAEGHFDAAVMLHVGMNIADKAALFAGVARVLKPGGRFAVYDVMRTGLGDIRFPLPWAGGPEVSFVATPEAYRRMLEGAGFAVDAEESRRDLALSLFRKMGERIAVDGPPPLGLHLVMGEDAAAKVGNVVAGLEAGIFAPVQILATKR